MPSQEQIQAQREQLERGRARGAQQEREEAQLRKEEEKVETLNRYTDELSAMVLSGKMSRSGFLAAGHKELKRLFGPLDPYQEQMFLYRIAMAELQEAGEITDAQMISDRRKRRGAQ